MSVLTTYLLIAFSAILLGANFNLAQPVMAEMQPLIAGASRYLIAAAIMLLIIWYRGEKRPLRHARAYLLLGLVGVFGFNCFSSWGCNLPRRSMARSLWRLTRC